MRVLSLLPVVAGLGFAFNDSAAPLFMGLRVLPGGIVYCIAKGIFADGLTLVGYATNPSGNTEGGIPTLPEPATALLLGLGFEGMSVRTPRPHELGRRRS